MFKTLEKLLQNTVGNGLARVLKGSGLALLSGAALLPVVQSALAVAMQAWSGVPADVAAIAYKSGIGVALSSIGAAMLTVAGMKAAGVGIAKASA